MAIEREGDWSFLKTLIHTFLNNTAAQIRSLRTAASLVDLGALAAGSHTLKGSALAMNADRLAKLSREIEEDARCGRARDYAAMVDRLEEALHETREAMTAYESALPQGDRSQPVMSAL
jgi:HPt (histidine-containing phosphotransfer) domain-containing protein